MSLKVLILSSTPRKGGNSDILCDQFAKGAREAGHQVEKVRLAEKNIGYCHACYACRHHGCVQQDDAGAILDQMMAADVIVLATPVYFYTMSAQLKALIDRSVAIYPRLTHKRYYYIMTMADTDSAKFEGTLAALRGFLDCYDGSVEEGIIRAPGVYEKGEVSATPAFEEAYRLGKALS